MNNRDIENFIKKEVRKETPDVLQGVKTRILLPRRSGEEDKKTVVENIENIIETKKVRTFDLKPALAFMAAVLLLVVGGFSVSRFGGAALAAASIVEFDVNPSVEIKLNSKGRIINAVPLNEDGEKILADMDLSNTDVNVGVNAIIGSMYKNGYVNELQNSVLVSVQDKNKARGERLREEITKQVNDTLAAYSVEGAVVSQNYEGGKTGKEEFINKIIESGLTNGNGEPYTKESLSELSINELNVILNSKNKSAANTSTVGTASTKKYIGVEKAKEIAFGDAKVNVADVRDLSVDLDYEKGVMIYEVDFEVGENEYDYDINAVTGAIIRRKIDKDNDDAARNNGGNQQPNNNAAQNGNNSPAGNNNNGGGNGGGNSGGNSGGSNGGGNSGGGYSGGNGGGNNSKPAQTTAKTAKPAAAKTTKATTKATAKKTTKAASSGGNISASKARSIALNNAGVSNPRDLDVEFDDGYWEVDFKANGKEYEYKISRTGQIVSKKVERDD